MAEPTDQELNDRIKAQYENLKRLQTERQLADPAQQAILDGHIGTVAEDIRRYEAMLRDRIKSEA